ncbi:hypothetical protein EDB86DRAFT_2824920 [Lactarius hatsudake]|nr:hypothetical protein EDB86DRAFT_2824920 [Lactarius hatsudake]
MWLTGQVGQAATGTHDDEAPDAAPDPELSNPRSNHYNTLDDNGDDMMDNNSNTTYDNNNNMTDIDDDTMDDNDDTTDNDNVADDSLGTQRQQWAVTQQCRSELNSITVLV